MDTTLDINNLKKGTWSYAMKINEIDKNGEEKLLTLEEIQLKINQILSAIDSQKGKLIQIVEVNTRGGDARFMEGAEVEKVHLFVVTK